MLFENNVSTILWKVKEILVVIPWAPEGFSRGDEEFRRPQADDTNGEAARKNSRGSLFLDLTETGNRAWKASGTQGIVINVFSWNS